VAIFFALDYVLRDSNGVHMTDIELAVLRSLVIRPSQTTPRAIQSIIVALEESGHITQGPSGWIATEKGCIALEQTRSKAYGVG
jgi:hypothetical protein